MRYEANRFVLQETNTTDVLEPVDVYYQKAGEELGNLAIAWAMGGQIAAPFGMESAILPLAGSDPTAEQAVQALSAVVTYEDIHRAKQAA